MMEWWGPHGTATTTNCQCPPTTPRQWTYDWQLTNSSTTPLPTDPASVEAMIDSYLEEATSHFFHAGVSNEA